MGGRRTRLARPANVKRALRRQLGRALSELRPRSPVSDASVHEARKELKRARATLRLLRDAIGDARYRRANRRLRDAARPLSRVRDAKVLVDLASGLRAKETRAARRRQLVALEKGLRSERRRLRRDVLGGRSALPRIREAISSVRREGESWPAPANASLRLGALRLYRRGRKAFARADADPEDERLHESRKQTKYLGRALEVLAPARGSEMAERAELSASIADALGDDHDLAVLRERLAARPRSDPGRAAMLSQIAKRRRKLQRKASKQSRRLYGTKAKAFAGDLDLGRRARG